MPSAGPRARDVHRAVVLSAEPRIQATRTDYHASADLTGQANHLGVTIEADIVKQKQPDNNGGYNALNFGKTHKLVYDKLTRPPDRVDALAGGQLLHGPDRADQLGRRFGLQRPCPGGHHRGDQQASRRHGPDLRPQGVPEPMEEGVKLLNAIQDVFICNDVTIA